MIPTTSQSGLLEWYKLLASKVKWITHVQSTQVSKDENQNLDLGSNQILHQGNHFRKWMFSAIGIYSSRMLNTPLLNKFERVGGRPCAVRSKLNKLEHIWGLRPCPEGSQGRDPIQKGAGVLYREEDWVLYSGDAPVDRMTDRQNDW